jgi:hypothetical protein
MAGQTTAGARRAAPPPHSSSTAGVPASRLPQPVEYHCCSLEKGNGPNCGWTSTRNSPLRLGGTRHEYLHVPPQPYSKLAESQVLPALSTTVSFGGGSLLPFCETPATYSSPDLPKTE